MLNNATHAAHPCPTKLRSTPIAFHHPARPLALPNQPWQAWEPLLRQIQEGTQVTLVCSAKDKEHNNAVALRAYLQRQLWRGAVAEH